MTTRPQDLRDEGLWHMVRARAFDQAMCRHNPHWHEARGEEAAYIGAFLDLHEDDVVAPHFRGACGVALMRDIAAEDLASSVFGGPDSLSGGFWRGDICPAPSSTFIGMFSGALGNSVAFATGAALHLKRAGGRRVAVCAFGDGTANAGIVHESMNLAVMLALPVVYVCQNNQYATSLPSTAALPGGSVAARARVLGMPAVDVDGNDLDAVRAAVREGVDRARAGGGPSCVNAETYRLGGHFMNDPEVYRTPEEVADRGRRDPVTRAIDRLADQAERGAWAEECRRLDELMDAVVVAAKGFGEVGRRLPAAPYVADVMEATS